MLERALMSNLLEWQQKTTRQPILLNGARQTGKTFILKTLFAKSGKFRRTHYLDFERDPSIGSIFDDGLDPETVFSNIGLRFGEPIDVSKDLIIFDEVGSCAKALQSLKYVSEELPYAFVVATGSNISLLQSFPVGRVELMDLFPLTFGEFIDAAVPQIVVDAYYNRLDRSESHRQLWSALLDYFYVGGMPEAVNNWITPNHSLVERVANVRNVHRNLIDTYTRDFGKYSGPVNAQHTEAVFRSVPLQLEKSIDDSVKRFRFQGPIKGKNRYSQLRGPIDWLAKAKLVSKNYPITHEPKPPLNIQIKENLFKLFLFDVGLLGHLSGMSYEDQRNQTTTFKGFIAENFVQNELIAQGLNQTYSWEQAKAQIEFIIRNNQGDIVPVEVKSGKRTKAKSLTAYINRYNPKFAIKLIGARGEKHDVLTTLPLYYASAIFEESSNNQS